MKQSISQLPSKDIVSQIDRQRMTDSDRQAGLQRQKERKKKDGCTQ
jgi:hypothetical protein